MSCCWRSGFSLPRQPGGADAAVDKENGGGVVDENARIPLETLRRHRALPQWLHRYQIALIFNPALANSVSHMSLVPVCTRSC